MSCSTFFLNPQLQKSSSNPALTDGNSCYSLAGAVYNVYTDSGCTKLVGSMTTDEKKELLRGMADVTAYIRRSNIAFGQEGWHRVYIEIPGNWQLVIDIANMLKDLDIPVQTIDFGHPNFRDSNLKKYNEGKKYYWKKEHQVKIWANEFLPIGFNIVHKQRALEKYADELLEYLDENKPHKFYWEKPLKRKNRPFHPMVNDDLIPEIIRGKHYESWTLLAKDLGYGE